MAFVGVAALGHCAFSAGRALCGQRGRVLSTGCRAASIAPAPRVLVHASAQAQKGRTQQETEWNVVSVLENSEACEAHRYVVVDVGVTSEKGSLIDAYRYPGMYVQMRRDANSKPAFLAISCAPNLQGVFEFLIKDNESTEWVSELRAGDSVEMTPVMGRGFPISPALDLRGFPAIPEDEVPRDILLFATGSGIAPIRACIESMLNGLDVRSRRNVRLYYGARYPSRMAYMDRFPLWREDGVDVIPVMSQPELSDGGWDGKVGYVQDALQQDGIANPKETGAVLCGVKAMTVDVREMLVNAGVPNDRILLNF
eukprot:IDg13478t1